MYIFGERIAAIGDPALPALGSAFSDGDRDLLTVAR